MPIAWYSFFLRCTVVLASIIISAIPQAATGVRTGAMPVNQGTVRPTAPRNSERPINLTVLKEKSLTYGNCFSSFSLGWDNFVIPAKTNIAVSNICIIQSAVFIFLIFYLTSTERKCLELLCLFIKYKWGKMQIN